MNEENDFYTLEELWQMLFLRPNESLDECCRRLILTSCERSQKVIDHLPAGENPNPYKWNLKCFTKEMMRWRFESAYLESGCHRIASFMARGGKREDYQPDPQYHPDNWEWFKHRVY